MQAFVAMPFNPDFLGVWKSIKAACLANGIEACRVDQLPQVDDIYERIFLEIDHSDLVIVDFTGDQVKSVPNPNVVTEAKHAKDRSQPIILLTQNLEALPFDWRTHRAIIYENTPEGLDYLQEVLTENLEGLKKRLNRGERPRYRSNSSSKKTARAEIGGDLPPRATTSGEKHSDSATAPSPSTASSDSCPSLSLLSGYEGVSLATIFSIQEWRLKIGHRNFRISLFLGSCKVYAEDRRLSSHFGFWGSTHDIKLDESGEAVHYQFLVQWRWHYLSYYLEVRRKGEVLYSDK